MQDCEIFHQLGRRRRMAVIFGLAFAAILAWPTLTLANEGETTDNVGFNSQFGLIWGLCLLGSVAALAQAFFFYKKMMASDPGNDRMQEIAGYVREGANAYLKQQYKVVGFFFVIIVILLAYAAFGLNAQSHWVPFAFLTGGFFSALAGWFGMKTATWASSRTAAGAQKSLNQGLQVAFRSGAVMGLTVVGLGLLDITLWFAVLYWGFGLGLVEVTVTMLCFGMGASTQALFARVGGGIFTKAADVGADLVGKVEQGIPEDDPRNPATIADNVGDNVGDVAGMGADLYESYCGSILATAALGVAAYSTSALLPDGMSGIVAQLRALFLPLAIAGAGILFSIIGIYLVRTKEDATQKNLLKALARGINASTILIIAATIGLTLWLMPATPGTVIPLGGMELPGVAISVIVGLLAGWLIGKWTEYSTSNEFKPTKDLADQAQTGPATIIIGGIAEGMMSTWFPVIVVCVATIASFGFAAGWHFDDIEFFALGLYGVGIAAVGMLSTLGITLATDAYGPIADNAGGNAEMSHLDPYVRERTDALDALGNTTAATGKGFAIGSAALTALALLAAYVEEVRVGFDRWGNSAIEESVQSGDITEPGFYKLSRQFFVEVEQGEGGLVAGKKYLALPDQIRDERVKSNWASIEFATPARIPHVEGDSLGTERSAVLTVIREREGRNVPEHVRFSASDAELAELHSAPLPTFIEYYEANLMNPKVLVGVLLGAMATFIFCAMTMKAVGRAARGMVEEVRRQFKEKPGIMEGKDMPDYARPVAISTKAAQKEMILPSLLALILPVATGLVLGVGGVLGLLVGTLAAGFCVAVFMANAGGAWDNAKKHIEGGALGGKYLKNDKGQYVDVKGNVVQDRADAKNPAHGAAVIGDTVGDPFKDTSGPSLNILIKLMSMVSVVVAGLVVRYSLYALGWF